MFDWLKKLFKKEPDLPLKEALHRAAISDEEHETIEVILTPAAGTWRDEPRPLSPAQQAIKEAQEEHDRND
jgi:hypothetical protein